MGTGIQKKIDQRWQKIFAPEVKPLSPKDPLLDVPAAAAYLNLTTSFVYAAVKRKDLACQRFGRLIRFSQEDLDAYVQANRQEATA